MSEAEIDDVLDLIGFGNIQFLMLFTCGMITVYLNNELMGISLVSISIDCEFSMNDSELSLLSVAAFVGLILSSHYAGYKTDHIGRRAMVIYSLMFSLISSFFSAVMPNFYSILFWRFMTGLCLSGAGLNTVTYITEYTKIALRPRMVNFMSYAITLGSIYMPALATFMEPLNRVLWSMGDYDVHVWRFSMLAHCLPGVAAFVGMWVLPETAKFMLSVGDYEGAYNALDRLCLSNRKQDLKSFGITSITQPHLHETVSITNHFFPRIWNDTKMLFSKEYFRDILHITIILSGFTAVGNGFGLWFAKMRHYMSSENLILCESLDYCQVRNYSSPQYHCLEKTIRYTDGIILGCSALGCCIMMGLMLLWISRRVVLTCNALVAALFGLSLNFVKLKAPQLIAMVLFITLCSSSISLAGSAVTDTVPTHLRGKAAGLTFMVARLSIIGTSLLHGHFMCTHCVIFINFFVDLLFVVAILSFLLPV